MSFESAVHKVAIHGVPFRAVLCRGDSTRAVREMVVVPLNFGCSWCKLMSSSHLLAVVVRFPYCLVDIGGVCQAPVVVPVNHSRSLPMHPALSEHPRRDPICCRQVVCLAGCAHHVVDLWLQCVFCLVLWHAVEGGSGIAVTYDFILIAEVLWIGYGRVFLRFTV